MTRKTISLTTMICLLLTLTLSMNVTAYATSNVVSYVDTTGDKQVMYVDGQPFFYMGTQHSPNRLMKDFGWTDVDMNQIFYHAAQDGFTAIACQAEWCKVEPTKDSFDWSSLDVQIDMSESNHIKMEILWLGSDCCTGSMHAPQYVLNSYQPVLTAGGSPVMGSDGVNKLDKSDPNLLAREEYVMKTMMNHIRSYISQKSYSNVVIGVEVLNEPTVIQLEDGTMPTDRSYSGCANTKWASGGYTDNTKFNGDIAYEYYNGLAQAVKTSDYSVWTRVNWCDSREAKCPGCNNQDIAGYVIAKNEANRLTGNAYLDFAGHDPYESDPQVIYNFSQGAYSDRTAYNMGKNLYMTMENGGWFTNTDKLAFSCYAGDGRYHIWEFSDSLNGAVDGWPDGTGLYASNYVAKTISPRSQAIAQKNMNYMLEKDWYDLATLMAAGPNCKFFNYVFAPNFDSSATIGSQNVRYISNAGGGIAIAKDPGTYIFMSAGSGEFRLPSDISVISAEKGYYDSNNIWVSEGNAAYSAISLEFSFQLNSYDCVRVLYNAPFNYALNKTVNASSSYEAGGWSMANAVNGTTVSGWTSDNDVNNNHLEWITIDLGSSVNIGHVKLYTRTDAGMVGEGFPIDFAIYTSNDYTNWTAVANAVNYPKPDASAQTFNFPTQNARYIEIVGTNLRLAGGQYRMQLSEVEVYGASANLNNYALNKSVNASSSYEVGGWSMAYAVNGTTVSGWTSDSDLDADHSEWITVDMGSSYNIGCVKLYARMDPGMVGEGFPVDFTVNISEDNIHWTIVANVTNYPKPDANAQVFNFLTQNARYVCINASSLPLTGGQYRMQLAEIEVY